MFSIFQEAPFDTVDLEFVYFFFPYIITAAIPTTLALGWKELSFERLLGCWKFWLSTCYVPVIFLSLLRLMLFFFFSKKGTGSTVGNSWFSGVSSVPLSLLCIFDHTFPRRSWLSRWASTTE